MSTELSPLELREAIAESIAAYQKAYEVADYCVRLGLPPAAEGENPFYSKRVYVRGKLAGLSKERLYELAKCVAEEFGDGELQDRLGFGAPRGVNGELRNIIFASVGPKPRIVMSDAMNNVIDVVEHKDSCLIYDQPLSGEGLTWDELTDWWMIQSGLTDRREAARALYQRLSQSLSSPPEKLLFRTYCERFGREDGGSLPALLPQVYLHYDPYTRAEWQYRTGEEVKRERMDFLLLLPRAVRVVLEVDGKQHYAAADGQASTRLYAEMVAEDRKIRLRGYEVYRFGGLELSRPSARALLDQFFDELLSVHVPKATSAGSAPEAIFDF